VEGIQKVKPGVQVSAKVEKVKEIASPAESAPASVSGPKEVKGK
jgi:hypothetical protein